MYIHDMFALSDGPQTKTTTMQENSLRKPVIWVVNDAGHSYNKARKLVPDAEIKPLTLGDVNPLYIDRLSSHLARGIASFAAKDDYLLVSGKPDINMIAGVLWVLQFGGVNLLQWKAKQREYQLRRLDRERLEDLLDQEMRR